MVSPVLRVGAGFAATGLAFSLANLVLARYLSRDAYGLVSLVVGILVISTAVAPAGTDLVVLRGFTAPRGKLYARAASTGAVVALAVAGWAAVQYHLPSNLVAIIALTTFTGGLTVVSATWLQARQRFWSGLCMAQCANLLLLVSAVASAIRPTAGADLPLWILAGGYAVAAVVGWRYLAEAGDAPGAPYRWEQAASLIVVNAASLIFMQTERLIAPSLLGLADVATFGVAATLVGSPFRMLQTGVGYTLVPRLRATSDTSERRRLVVVEGRVAAVAVVGAAMLAWVASSLIVRWFLAGKYQLEPALVAATIWSGILRVISAFATSIVTALGSTRQLGLLGVIAWLSVAIGVAGGVIGARWGLSGLVFGVAAGWLFRCAVVSVLALPHLRQ
jgi:O-antigen/teichoic acid export membrane protein